jgi:glycosyltransferase involved in cell wall biosynthesis
MRVLIITAAYPPSSGGVATHVANLAHGLIHASQRNSVCVLTLAKNKWNRTYENRQLVVWKIPQKTVPNFFGRRAPYEDVMSTAMRRLNASDVDLIHAHDFDSIQIGCMLKAGFRKPLIATIHRAPTPWKRGRLIEEPKDCFVETIKVFKLCDALVVPSRCSRDILVDQGLARNLIKIIPHGVSPKYLASFCNIDSILGDLHLERDEELILCPVRAEHHKDPLTFVRAAGLLKQKMLKQNATRRLRFLVTCEKQDPDYDVLSTVAKQIGIEPGRDIEFRCFARRFMPTLYRRASACVVPSRRESFGQTVLEAFVYRTPVIAANTSALKEIVHHGTTGLLFTDGNPEDLAGQLERILVDNRLAARLRTNALRSVEKYYNSDRMVRQYRRLFQRVIGKRTRKK